MPIYMNVSTKLCDGSVRPGVQFMGDGSVFLGDGSVTNGIHFFADGSVRVELNQDVNRLLPQLTRHFANHQIRSIDFSAGGSEGVLIGLLLPAVQKILVGLERFMAVDVKVGFKGIPGANSFHQQLIGFLPAGVQLGQIAFG